MNGKVYEEWELMGEVALGYTEKWETNGRKNGNLRSPLYEEGLHHHFCKLL